ncbi:MAG: guanylate kinase [Bacteroidales bacterium]|nr:guanylate kinase [Bacteroidales bacterium]
MKEGKIIILSAPSGTGKSTIIRNLVGIDDLRLGFSVSATSRLPRGEEKHGVEYYFLSEKEFKERVERGEFVEWEEVYPGTCYGTLLSEVTRVTHAGRNLIMDVDVKGALNIKRYFGEKALAIFVMPPSKEELEKRLRERSTDSEESILKRLAKADFEMSFAPEFDTVVVNDDLEEAVNKTAGLIRKFSE